MLAPASGTCYTSLEQTCHVEQERMRVIAKKMLREFWETHGDVEQALKAWYQDAKNADWKGPNDIKKTYASASIIANNRVVFNIRGNTYRLVVAINYEFSIVYIRFVGTHKEYDQIDAETV
jgi:mRNA interferase HigB